MPEQEPGSAPAADLVAAVTRLAAAQEGANILQAKAIEAQVALVLSIERQSRLTRRLAASMKKQGDALLQVLTEEPRVEVPEPEPDRNESPRFYLNGKPVNGSDH